MSLGMVVFFSFSSLEAQVIPKGQDAGARQQDLAVEKRDEKIAKQLAQSKEDALVGDEKVLSDGDIVTPGTDNARVLINKIEVEGALELPERVVRSIVDPYEMQTMSISDMRKIADLITKEYRSRGNVTTFAYLIPQKITNNTLRIAVAEGNVGAINIDGNKYFSERLLQRYLDMRKDDIFNYDKLRTNLNYINANQDINVNAVLERGDEKGQTDINLHVKDRFPLHATLGMNNYNSRYLDRYKYLMELQYNNFLGLGHILTGEIQLGEADRYQLYSARYLAPLDSRNSLGLSYIRLNQRLGREVGDLEIKGTGDIISLFHSFTVVNTDTLNFAITPGFTYKDIDNEVLNVITSEDNVRIAKLGFDVDYTDPFAGRTIITQEFDCGIKDIFGGLGESDYNSSRTGANGSFFKSVTNFARVQALPADLSLMLKGSLQLSNDSLPSAEQIFIGGPTTVRGYPVSEQGGDSGYQSSIEFYIPPYGLPRDWVIPYSQTSFYDAFRFMFFFDWGLVNTNSPQLGERVQDDIYSIGPAIRFNIPQRLSVNLDWGIQLGQDSSDGSNTAGYIEVKLYF
jgi:hemolysin activation/secretion protein